MDGYNDAAINEILSKLSLSGTKKSLDELSSMSEKYCYSSQNRIHLSKIKMDPRSKDYDEIEAFRQMEIAADGGNPKAIFMLANMYRAGYGTKPNMKMYNHCIRAAARKGCYEAKKILEESKPKIRNNMNKISSENDALKSKHCERVKRDHT